MYKILFFFVYELCFGGGVLCFELYNGFCVKNQVAECNEKGFLRTRRRLVQTSVLDDFCTGKRTAQQYFACTPKNPSRAGNPIRQVDCTRISINSSLSSPGFPKKNALSPREDQEEQVDQRIRHLVFCEYAAPAFGECGDTEAPIVVFLDFLVCY